jgi:formyltetrahydrofolate deformylase
MVGKGCDLEKVVLSRAVRWHLENRILVYQNKTVVFVLKRHFSWPADGD